MSNLVEIIWKDSAFITKRTKKIVEPIPVGNIVRFSKNYDNDGKGWNDTIAFGSVRYRIEGNYNYHSLYSTWYMEEVASKRKVLTKLRSLERLPLEIDAYSLNFFKMKTYYHPERKKDVEVGRYFAQFFIIGAENQEAFKKLKSEENG